MLVLCFTQHVFNVTPYYMLFYVYDFDVDDLEFLIFNLQNIFYIGRYKKSFPTYILI